MHARSAAVIAVASLAGACAQAPAPPEGEPAPVPAPRVVRPAGPRLVLTVEFGELYAAFDKTAEALEARHEPAAAVAHATAPAGEPSPATQG